MKFMKKQVEKQGFSGFSDDMCMVLLALPYGDEDIKSNIAEKLVLGPKNLKIHRSFSQK